MSDELSSEPVMHTVEARAHGWRIDHYLTRLYPNYSRALLQKAINEQAVLLNGLAAKPARKLHINDRVSIRLPDVPDYTVAPEELPLDILHEDEWIIVVNKQAGLITHPGRGNSTGTLANALQFHFDRLSSSAGQHRPGIVHRLDRNTSGVLVIAKDNQVHGRLSKQFEQRTVEKQYVALVRGNVHLESDWIETHIGVNPQRREKMMVCEKGGNARTATTYYEVAERFDRFTSVRLFPKTGRTHQLRVHMTHLGYPIIADKTYRGGNRLSIGELRKVSTLDAHDGAERDADATQPHEDDTLISRHALHAHRLAFIHPGTNKSVEFIAPWPDDMQRTLDALRQHRPT